MTLKYQFSKAPIQEAIIDIRVRLSPDFTAAQLEAVGVNLVTDYAEKQNLIGGEFRVELSEKQPESSVSSKHIGFRYTSTDKRYVLQTRLDGFTLSVLPPYDTWATFREEALRLWTLYRQVTNPEVIRIAVRYINRLDLPLNLPDSRVELRSFLRTFPEVSSDIPFDINDYFMQLQMSVPDLPGKLILSETIVPPPNPETISIILDNDLFCEENIPQTEKEIWELFERMREYKNKLFVACITEKTKELIS